MKDIKTGEYVRTRWGCIAKFEGIHEGFYEFDNIIMDESSAVRENLFVDIVEKTSPNIIDLIEVGDYINGMKITNKYIDEETGNIELEFNNGSSYLYPKSWNYEARSEEYKIKSIVTRKQFSQMEYRIG